MFIIQAGIEEPVTPKWPTILNRLRRKGIGEKRIPSFGEALTFLAKREACKKKKGSKAEF